ncbi:MAG: GAF domain-containing protein [Chloroflexi bacterium]|nr:MAG: GAF domain-containing protein [Chloroflexota bacterium]
MTTILSIALTDNVEQGVRAALGQKYNLVAVADGSAAIQYCAMIQPDVVLIDSDLADLDLSELTLRLKMFMPHVPILVFVAQLPRQTIGMDSVASADAYLTKPVNPAQLQDTLQRLLPAPDTPGPRNVEQFENQILALNQANQRLASLNAVSALIGTSLDLDHLTDEILRQIQKNIDFDSATLFLLKGNLLEAAASRGFSEYKRGLNVYHKSDRNSAWRVVTNKLPLIINDVTQSDYWEPRPELSRIRAWLGVPLIFKDRVVGVLTLDKNEPAAFTNADARYVFTLAYQIAIAVENAQLFQEWENQATRLKLINELNREITTILDIGQLYQTLARAIVERLGYDRVAALEMLPNRAGLILRACHYADHSFAQSLEIGNYRASRTKGFIGRAVQSGRPLLINHVDQPNQCLPGLPVKSVMVVPVFLDGHIEAVINVDCLRPNGFNDHDLWTMSSVATQAATVIENARLYQDVDTYSARLEKTVAARTQRLQAIRQISQVISRRVNVDELLAVVGQAIHRIFAGSTGDNLNIAAGLVRGASLHIQMIYHPTPHPASLASQSFAEGVYSLDYQSEIGRIIRHAKAKILNNIDPATIFHTSPAQPAGRHNALMVAPLITAGKPIGVILVNSNRSNSFDEDDLETLESVAFQVASAIEYARLLRKTKEMAIVDERTRLARDMHDGVAQNLAYLLIQVDRGLNMVEEGSPIEQQLELIGNLLQQNIAELRRNIFDLRPIALEGKSLFEVLENFVTEFGRRWNLDTTCNVTGSVPDVPAEVESSIYRILQEALSNARRHARCSRVSVDLSVNSKQWIELKIQDDGQGFNPANVPDPAKRKGHGLGLISMRERAESVGGTFLVDSAPGRGTTIRAELPLQAVEIAAQMG